MCTQMRRMKRGVEPARKNLLWKRRLNFWLKQLETAHSVVSKQVAHLKAQIAGL
ncbi:hypothetical protein LCGC14_0343460 [marine sediment metagenome]|uniref:Uncharacterized protein n=1 Tax=marine sediment metagenome TaxID=412755 RepID=A0A0F9WKW8_9ZZZZ